MLLQAKPNSNEPFLWFLGPLSERLTNVMARSQTDCIPPTLYPYAIYEKIYDHAAIEDEDEDVDDDEEIDDEKDEIKGKR